MEPDTNNNQKTPSANTSNQNNESKLLDLSSVKESEIKDLSNSSKNLNTETMNQLPASDQAKIKDDLETLEEKYENEIKKNDDLKEKINHLEEVKEEIENDIKKNEEVVKKELVDLKNLKTKIEDQIKKISELKSLDQEISKEIEEIKKLEEDKKGIEERILDLENKIRDNK